MSNTINTNTTVEISQVVLTLDSLSFKKAKEILSFGDVKETLKSTVFEKIS